MNIRSIRVRLTLWYSVALFLAIAVIFTSFFLATQRILFEQTDISLSSHGEKVVEVVTRQNTDMHEIIAKRSFITEFSEIPGMIVIILDKDGTIVSSSFSVEVVNEIFSKLFTMGKNSTKPIYSNEKIGMTGMRFYISPIRNNNSFTGVVLVAHPIDIIQKSLSSLLLTLFVSFLVLAIPTILGGYYLAVRAMQPITAISEKIKLITSENLNERVGNPHTGDEIEKLSVTFNNLLDRLHGAFQRERQFIGDLAHELKTPLSTQQSGIEVTLSKKRQEKEYEKALQEALIDAKRISGTLNNILDLAWSEADVAKKEGESFSLSEIMNEIKEIAGKLAYQKNITVEGEIKDNIFVFGKKDKLFRAILNLIDNAIKYTPAEGKVNINLSNNNDNAILKIKDNGLGIAKNDLPHVFERFYRGEKSDKSTGTGLGLAIAKSIITVHQGKIKVDNNETKGTLVTVILPIVKKSS